MNRQMHTETQLETSTCTELALNETDMLARWGFDPHEITSLLYRGVDRTQSRLSRLKELQDRIDQRPRFNHTLDVGAMALTNSGSLS